jgi:Flp pilus assembly protein CpaB
MKKKEIIGFILIAGGVGALSYLYNSYYKAYKEAMQEKAQETKTTTK